MFCYTAAQKQTSLYVRYCLKTFCSSTIAGSITSPPTAVRQEDKDHFRLAPSARLIASDVYMPQIINVVRPISVTIKNGVGDDGMGDSIPYVAKNAWL